MKNNAVLLAIIAALSLGIGVTGTLLWAEKQAPKPVAAPVAPSTSPQTVPSTIGLAPDQAALTLGNYYYDMGQWPQAIAQYRTAIANGLDNPNVRTDLGNALRFGGQPQKSLEQYQIAQRQDPNHQESLFNQGGLWAQSLNDPAKGVAAWRAYLKRFPNGQTAPQAREFIKQFGK